MNESPIFRCRMTTLILVVALAILTALWFSERPGEEPSGLETPQNPGIAAQASQTPSADPGRGPTRKIDPSARVSHRSQGRRAESIGSDAEDSGILRFAEAANLDPSQVAEMKASYFCDLAAAMRERCEKVPRSAEQLEFCLKSMGYYTNSRHCGFQP